MIRTTAKLLKAAGAFVDIERAEPHLHKFERKPGGEEEFLEAIMDIHALWPGSTQPRLVDITVRSAQAERYKKSSSVIGEAAVGGESQSSSVRRTSPTTDL